MKASLWIGAAALAALFAAGCDDDRALGTEKNQDTPVAPPPPAPYQDPALNPYKGVDIAPPAMNEVSGSNKAKETTDADKNKEMPPLDQPKEMSAPGMTKQLVPNDGSSAVDSSNAQLQVVEVENGEDLASIPDLTEPIWAP